MIGVDICSISKIQKIIEQNPKAMQRFFCTEEQVYLEQKNNVKWQSAAAMFAGKEALLKSFGRGIGAVALNEICIAHLPSGQPYIKLLGNAQQVLYTERTLHISLSHEQDMAIAVVMHC